MRKIIGQVTITKSSGKKAVTDLYITTKMKNKNLKYRLSFYQDNGFGTVPLMDLVKAINNNIKTLTVSFYYNHHNNSYNTYRNTLNLDINNDKDIEDLFFSNKPFEVEATSFNKLYSEKVKIKIRMFKSIETAKMESFMQKI